MKQQRKFNLCQLIAWSNLAFIGKSGQWASSSCVMQAESLRGLLPTQGDPLGSTSMMGEQKYIVRKCLFLHLVPTVKAQENYFSCLKMK